MWRVLVNDQAPRDGKAPPRVPACRDESFQLAASLCHVQHAANQQLVCVYILCRCSSIQNLSGRRVALLPAVYNAISMLASYEHPYRSLHYSCIIHTMYCVSHLSKNNCLHDTACQLRRRKKVPRSSGRFELSLIVKMVDLPNGQNRRAGSDCAHSRE